jgi:hypothetical protein
LVKKLRSFDLVLRIRENLKCLVEPKYFLKDLLPLLQNVKQITICFTGKSFSEALMSYCGLIDTRIRASDKDLPVMTKELYEMLYLNCFYKELKWIKT